MRGDPQDELLVVAPGEQQAAGREAQDAVLLRRGFQRQLLQLLCGGSDLLSPPGPWVGEGEGDRPCLSPLQSLTLAVSSSCRSSSRLEGFSEEVTQVRWPRNWMAKRDGVRGVVGEGQEEVTREPWRTLTSLIQCRLR